MVTKFLLIDDDSDDRELFCEAMGEIDPDISCFTATNGRRALMKLHEGEIPSPDIIFLDINMPGMTGWQCLTVLKELEAYKHIPVVMYSTTSHFDLTEKAHNGGAFCLFTKPASFKELKRSLAIFVYHLKHNSLPLILTSPILDADA